MLFSASQFLSILSINSILVVVGPKLNSQKSATLSVLDDCFQESEDDFPSLFFQTGQIEKLTKILLQTARIWKKTISRIPGPRGPRFQILDYRLDGSGIPSR